MTRKEYVLLYAPIFAIGVCFVILGSLYTAFPNLLVHSPVSFETRGSIHHLWHYTILVGGFALTIGVWQRHLMAEVVGLWACGLVILLNLVALFAEDVSTGSDTELSGMDAASRIVLLLTIGLRLYAILVVNPRITRDLSGESGRAAQLSRQTKEEGDRGR